MTTPIEMLRDPEGYLLDPEAWDETLAEALAREENLELNPLTWSILRFMREYWREHQVAPDVRHVVAFIGGTHAIDKQAAKELLFRCFPYGYVQQTCKLAGMLRPRAWSTG